MSGFPGSFSISALTAFFHLSGARPPLDALFRTLHMSAVTFPRFTVAWWIPRCLPNGEVIDDSLHFRIASVYSSIVSSMLINSSSLRVWGIAKSSINCVSALELEWPFGILKEPYKIELLASVSPDEPTREARVPEPKGVFLDCWKYW